MKKAKMKVILVLINLLFLFRITNPCSAQLVLLPYSTDFESGTIGWSTSSVNTLTEWEYGTPNFGTTIGSHSGNNCWDINLDSGYYSSANSMLYSPIFDISGITLCKLSLWLNFNSEMAWDGMRIDYCINSGSTWQVLGSKNDTNALNWYNESWLISSSLPAWTGNSNGWKKSTYVLQQISGQNQVQFRFVFTSDFSVNIDGISMDDFSLQIVPNYDAEIVSVTTPSSSYLAGLLTDSITINVKNAGASAITTFSYEYKLNGIFNSISTYNGNLLPGSSVQVRLPGFIVNQVNNLICGHITLLNDADTTNNNFCYNLNGIIPYTIPYSEDFELSNSDWYSASIDTITKWEYGNPNFGATIGAHSGNNCWDINLTTAYGDSATCILYSPYFDISGNIISRISFWLNYSTENNWDGTRIEYTLNNGITWTVLGVVNDPFAQNWYNQSSLLSSLLPAWMNTSLGWKKSVYTLNQLQGFNHVQFRFVFTSDASVNGDGFSIDDFSITHILPNDIELTSIATGLTTYGIGLTTDSILFSIQNTGSFNISNFNFEYSVNGVQQFSATNFGIIAPGGTLQILLPGFVFNLPSVTLCGKITMVNDGDTTNNTFCIPLNGIPSYSLNWSDNFDNGINVWTTQNISGANTNWQLGTPNYGATNSSYSSPKCWDINLSTAYTVNAKCYLYSPFFDISTSLHPRIEFWQNRNTYSSYDGAYLEYQSGFDPNWYLLGMLSDPNGVNWYTHPNIVISQVPLWSGNSNGWTKCEYNLDSANLNSTVRFRFVFASRQNTIIKDGISIDNFKISHVLNNDALLHSSTFPTQNVPQGVPSQIEVELKNNGLQTLTSLSIKYSLNGGTPVSTIWNGSLQYDSTILVTLPPFIPVIGTNTITAYIEWGSDLDHENDTISFTTFGTLTSNLPYAEDFESGTGGWYTSQNGMTNWEYGLPNFSTLNSAHSGSNCWDINLTTPYFNLANAQLNSPLFDLSTTNIITLQFWLNYSSESGADGLFIEYTTDEINWQRLGSIGDPAGTNWYNSTLTLGNEGWSGISGGWQSCSYVYAGTWGINYFRFRLRFISDFNVVDAGISFDDISITGVTSVEELNENSNVIVYPNPAKDELFILALDNASPLEQIELRSIDGKVVYSQHSPSSKQIKISTTSFSAGVYLLGLTNENGDRSFKRIVIQH